jgi:tetratricopeptide (TPR) repeat protein
MDNLITTFVEIAPFLIHPLVLVGFVIMMLFGIHRQLLKTGIIPPLDQQQGTGIVKLLLSYGFWLGLLITVLGFGLQFYQTYSETEITTNQQAVKTSASIEQIVTVLSNKHQSEAQFKDEQIKALTQAVSDLSQGQGVIGSKAEIESAMQALAEGNIEKAKALFAKATQKGEQEALQTAKAYRNLGALAYLDNTQEALQAYRRATQLDPDNADGWNELGRLLRRIGELDQAIVAYEKVLTLGKAAQDKELVAVAYGNLGNVSQIRGELDKAIEFYQQSLVIEKALGRKQVIASVYTNLGVVYQIRGELDKAMEFYQQALVINKALERKEGMAQNYRNLGIVHAKKGNKTEARRYWKMSLELFQYIGSPNAEEVEASLDLL